MERLTKRKGNTAIFTNENFQLKLCGSCKTEDCHNCVVNSITERLATYEDAEKQGRIMVLPCKIGDTVYQPIASRGIISAYEIISIEIYKNNVFYCWKLIDGIYINIKGFPDFQLGKTVFLAREAAEAALNKNP